MARYLLLRLADAIPTVFLVLTLVFIAMRILPGDPALAALGDGALPEQLAEFRERMGLNVPLWQQYFNFIGGVLTSAARFSPTRQSSSLSRPICPIRSS